MWTTCSGKASDLVKAGLRCTCEAAQEAAWTVVGHELAAPWWRAARGLSAVGVPLAQHLALHLVQLSQC